MRATARLVATADGRGGTRLAVLSSAPPLVLRRTGPSGAPTAQVHLVGGAAGPLGGDLLRLEVEVEPGADVRVHSVAASLALPGANGAASLVEVVVRVAPGGRLSWLPEPLIAAAGCRHVAAAAVDVAGGGWLCWRDELICGRHGEQPGDARVTTAVRYAGRPIYRQDLAVGPGAQGWDGPAVLGAARASGSLLLVDPAWDQSWDQSRDQARDQASSPDPRMREDLRTAALGVPGAVAAVMPLAGPAVLVTAAGPDPRPVRAILDAALPRTAPHTTAPQTSASQTTMPGADRLSAASPSQRG